MTEIKRCPFCGELPVVCLKHGDMHNVSCETVDCCGENDLWWETEQEAIEAWNTRYEPTCEMVRIASDFSECQECGCTFPWHEAIDWYFCPNCGKKVIEE